jgi:hypothetical protein
MLDTEVGKEAYGLVRILLRKEARGIVEFIGDTTGEAVRMLTNHGVRRINDEHFSETIANVARKSFLNASGSVTLALKKISRTMTTSTLSWLCDSTEHCCF